MAPGGLVISKLALQASVDEELLKGLLCMKISIPKDVDTGLSKLPLFPDTSPQFLSQTLILPLPLSPSHLASRPIYTASVLLGLTSDSSHSQHNASPTPASSSRVQVQIETTRPEGPVYIAVQGGKRRRPSTGSNGGAGGARGMGGARREYLVCMQVEHDIQRLGNVMSIQLPLPKCLDNNLRLHILPQRAGPSAYAESDVSLLSEPKILPLPADAFDALRDMPRAGRGTSGRRGSETGSWADGETSGSEVATDEEEEVGSWVEGRFQGTDKLKLEWTYVPSAPVPHLHLTPSLASRSIGFAYETSLPSDCVGQSVPISLRLPSDWGLSELSIRARGLVSFNCLEDDALSALRPPHHQSDSNESLADDSFTTILAGPGRSSATRADGPSGPGNLHGRPVRSSASLMHQTLPAGDSLRLDEYSFEMGDQSREAALGSRPGTPAMNGPADKALGGRQSLSGSGNGRGSLSGGSDAALSVNLPQSRAVVAREVMLHFDPAIAMDADDARIIISGTLSPLRATLLISSSAPNPIPILSVGYDDSKPFDLTYTHAPDSPYYVEPADDVPSVEWRDTRGQPLPPAPRAGVSGMLTRVSRDAWGKQSAVVEFEWKSDGEVWLTVSRSKVGLRAGEGGDVRVVAASAGGRALHHAMVDTPEGMVLLLGSGVPGITPRGTARVCLESMDLDRVLLLHCAEAGVGDMRVELLGTNWPDLSAAETNLRPDSDPGSYTYVPSTTPPYLLLPSPLHSAPCTTSPTTAKSTKTWRSGKGLWSWSTLINIFLLYLLLSLAQQVQRLRHEVGFVKNEYGDLRQYASLRYDGRGADGGMAGESSYPPQDTSPMSFVAEEASATSQGSEVFAGDQATAASSPSPQQRQDSAWSDDEHVEHTDARHVGANNHAPADRNQRSGSQQPSEGLPRYDWQDGGTGRMQGKMPGYDHGDGLIGVQGRGRADPMGVGRVVVGQSAWDKLAAHPTYVSSS